jgi:addiction module HigA family antidote
VRKIPYPTPGKILLEEFLMPMGISAYRLAKDIGVPQIRIGQIIAGKRAITVDTGLQLDHDAAVAKDALAGALAKIKPLKAT